MAKGSPPAYRRRILIEPAPGAVTAELEDDYHRMVVTLVHDGETVRDVVAEMKRWPWTTCRGAIDQLPRTFVGKPLAAFAKAGERPLNCTHLHDLALFAAAHAHESAPVAYDVTATDPVDGRRELTIHRGGELVHHWTFQDDVATAPEAIAGRGFLELGDWIAGLDPAAKEAARILRWGSMVGRGRQMDIPAHSTTDRFPTGSCHTFQAGIAEQARRLPDADVDFSAPGREPLADRALAFANHSPK